MVSVGLTDKGIQRANNQDSYLTLNKGGKTICVVCDGIGGHKAGDVASKLACQIVEKEFESISDDIESWLIETIKVVNRTVYLQANQIDECYGMGTTLVSLVTDGTNTIIGNVGDSRCYGFKDDLKQLTVDHSLVNELIEKGYSIEEAELHGKHVITRAIGIEANVCADIYLVNEKYDYFLLASDGLFNYVSEADISRVLQSKKSLTQKANKLVELANLAGGYDNVTVVLVEG